MVQPTSRVYTVKGRYRAFLATTILGINCQTATRQPIPEDLALLRRAEFLLTDGTEVPDSPCFQEIHDHTLSCALDRASRDVFGDALSQAPSVQIVRRLQNQLESPSEALSRAQAIVRDSLLSLKLTAEVHMTPYLLVLLEDDLDSTPEDTQLAGHFANISRLEAEGTLVFAGPADAEGVSGIFLLRGSSLDGVTDALDQDPLIASGILRARVVPVWLPGGISWPNPKYGSRF